ncbi:hypothetical protein AGMMS50256_29170 [Betaproteobacteria bacterium]|nr:hypothetical protein AGMMS50256_29170 [Betaproteobacteria bacterium]
MPRFISPSPLFAAYRQDLAAAGDEAAIRAVLRRALADKYIAHHEYHALGEAARAKIASAPTPLPPAGEGSESKRTRK